METISRIFCVLILNHTLKTIAFQFATIGDWGQPNSHVGEALQKYISEHGGVDCIFSTGDNFYENGVKSLSDKQWEDTFEKQFSAPSVQVPWFVVLGNHDYYGNYMSQIQYTDLKNTSGRWQLPSNYYNKMFPLCTDVDKDCGSLEVLFIDTVLLDPLEDEAVSLKSGAVQQSQAKLQMSWIKQTLQNSTADWLFVIGHYPIYSIGNNGNDFSLQNDLRELFEEYHVDAYFFGHDHMLQHLTDRSVHFYGSGSGTKLEHSLLHKNSYDSHQRVNLLSLVLVAVGVTVAYHFPLVVVEVAHWTSLLEEWAALQYGFTFHTLTNQEMNVTFVNNRGEEIYSFHQVPSRLAGIFKIQAQSNTFISFEHGDYLTVLFGATVFLLFIGLILIVRASTSFQRMTQRFSYRIAHPTKEQKHLLQPKNSYVMFSHAHNPVTIEQCTTKKVTHNHDFQA